MLVDKVILLADCQLSFATMHCLFDVIIIPVPVVSGKGSFTFNFKRNALYPLYFDFSEFKYLLKQILK